MKRKGKASDRIGKSSTTTATDTDTLNIRIGTWNVRTLRKPGGLKVLADTLKTAKMDITAVQETRYPGKDVAKFNDYTFYYSGGDLKSRAFGTGFLITGKSRSAVMNFNPVNDRLCTIRIRGKFFNITIINGHAPTEDKDDETKSTFYEKLQALLDRIPHRDVKILIGDFNAQVGREEMYRPTIGKHSLHVESNDNGSRLVDFAVMNNCVIKSTFFPHKDIHKATWCSPDGRTFNQIDHVLISGRHCSSIMDVRTLRGPNIDSDHFLVRVKLRARVAVHTKRQPALRRFDVERLKDDAVREEYTAKMESAIIAETQNDDETVEAKWHRLHKTIQGVATEVMGWRGRKPRNDWFDEECQRALDEKNAARRKFLQSKTRASRETYKAKRTAERNLFKLKKANKEREMIGRIQSLSGVANSREKYREIKYLRAGHHQKPLLCRDGNGEVLADEEKCIVRWAEYFKLLLNQNVVEGENPIGLPDSALSEGLDTLEPDPSLEEVREVVVALKNNKSTGSDNIPAELFKYGGEALLHSLHDLLVNIWRTEELPQEWKVGIICPLYKKGDKLDCTNYRGITLLNVAYKILANVLYNRLLPYAEAAIGEYQCGFRKDRSTSDQMFSIRQILEKYREFQKDTHHLFVDFKAAYDSVLRDKLWHVMGEFSFPNKLIRMTQLTLRDVVSKVRIREQLSVPFTTENGLRQGDPLSTLLFNIALESAVRRSRVPTQVVIYDEPVQYLAYADDIDIVGKTMRNVREAFSNLEKCGKDIGLTVNIAKTKYMHATSRGGPGEQFQLRTGNEVVTIEKVENFIYLGTQVNSENDLGVEVRRRITQGNKCFYSLSKIFRSKSINSNTKCELYRTLVRPVVTYGSEAWVMTKKIEQCLQVFERRILRYIFGPINDGGLWRRRYNHELYQRYNQQDIVGFIRVNRLRWAGHVERMDSHRVPRRLLTGDPGGERRRGRPPVRWKDAVEKDFRVLRTGSWRSAARNRSGWRNVLEEAKTKFGCRAR